MVIERPRPGLALALLVGVVACRADSGGRGEAISSNGAARAESGSTRRSTLIAPGTVTWNVSEGPAGGTVTSGGGYTAPATEGTYHVTATSGLDPSKIGSATVTVSNASGYTTHGLRIPATHPRLWFSNATLLSQAKAWYAAHPYATNNDNGWEWTDAGWTATAMKGLLSNDATQCNAAIAAITSGNLAASVFPAASSTSSSCDQCRWFGEQVILTFDWCYNFMSAAQRAALVSAHNAWVQAWMHGDLDRGGVGWGFVPQHQNNYYWGYLRNELEWAITTYGESSAQTTFAEQLLDNVLGGPTQNARGARWKNDFLPATSADSKGGVNIEGSEYGPYMSWYPVVPFHSMDLLGLDLYGATNFYKENVYAYIYATTPAATTTPGGTGYTFFPHSDDESWWGSPSLAAAKPVADLMSMAAQKYGSLNVGKHARQWLSMVGAVPRYHLQATDPGGTALAFTGLPLDYYAPGARWLYARTAWGPTATLVWLEMGDRNDLWPPGYTGHSHADFGTWQIWRNGRFLSRETASYSGTVTGYHGAGTVDGISAIAHNALLFNGTGINSPYVGGVATVTRLESQPGYAFASTNLTPLAAGGNATVVNAVRDFVFVRDLETLVVFDRLQSSSASTVKTFVSHCEVSPTRAGNVTTCPSGTQALVMTTLLPAAPAIGVVNEGSNSNTAHQYRIEVDDASGVAQSYFLHVLQGRNSTDASLAPTVVDGGSSYTVNLDATHAITFAKGMTSTGGSVKIGSTTTPLRADVQPMTVTDAGPAWQ